MTNQAVETAFGAGITQANLDIIKQNIQITYISAALRYLNKMDNDLTGLVAGEPSPPKTFLAACSQAGCLQSTASTKARGTPSGAPRWSRATRRATRW